MSISLNVQIFFVSLSNKLFKSERLRKWVDTCNQQIYSLRETVQTIIQDRTALLRIYLWNMLKLVFWYVLPYLILIENHPKIDFLLTISFISFAVVLSGVIPTPAGIGSFEFVYLLLFRPVVGTVDAVSSLLLYRFSSFILPFLYGFVYVIAERRRVIKEEIIEVKKRIKKIKGRSFIRSTLFIKSKKNVMGKIILRLFCSFFCMYTINFVFFKIYIRREKSQKNMCIF